jgi:hypothetical protein
MGLKGISWIEQNVEKVVVGVFGVALLGVVAMQFVGEGNTIEVMSGTTRKKYSYDQVWDQVAQQARETRSRITSVEPDVKTPDIPQVLKTFTSQLQGPVAPEKALAAEFDRPTLEPYGLITHEGAGKGAKAEMYAALQPPPTGKPVAASYLATIHPQEVMAHEDVAQLIGAKAEDLTGPKLAAVLPKLDRAAVSVETTYNGTALEAMLMADPDADGPLSAMPRHWWDNGRVQILGVEMERQEMSLNGEWGEPTPVKHMPGRLDLLESVKQMEGEQGVSFADIMQAAVKQQDDVQRPAYYSIMLGEDWMPPSEAAEELAAATATPGGDAATQLKKRLAAKDEEIVAAQEEKRHLEEKTGPDDQPPTGRPPGFPTGGPGGKGGQPVGPGGRNPTPTRNPKEERIKRLENRIAQLFKERQRILDQATKLGITLEEPKDAGAAKPVTPPKTNEAATPLLLNPDLHLWAHDVTVQRGKTYRYRMTLVLNNPIYGKNAALDAKQADLAKNAVVRTAPSEWSDPVRVDPETFYFITGASPEDAFASSARASAEVFVFSMGYWRKGQVNLEPGDTIAADIKVPDPEKVLSMIAMDPNQPMMPSPQPAGGPRGVPRGVPGPEGERGVPPRPMPGPGGGPGNDGQPIDPATLLIPKMVEEDALLLDVATTTVVKDQGIGGTKTENQAFLLNEDGQIVVRTPEGDRARSEYAKVVRSAEKGEEALRPKAMKPIIDTTRPAPTEPGTPFPRPDGGGGGGGG